MTHVHCGSKTDPVALITSFRTHELGVNCPEHQSSRPKELSTIGKKKNGKRPSAEPMALKHLKSTIVYSLIHIPSSSLNAPHKDGRPTSMETILWSS